jgi:hypothetical protein
VLVSTRKPVDAIMTCQAFETKQLKMIEHKYAVIFQVALSTCVDNERAHSLRVACHAINTSFVPEVHMRSKRETHGFVGKSDKLEAC